MASTLRMHTTTSPLFCGPQLTTTTCLRWSWHSKKCFFAFASEVKTLWCTSSPVHKPDGYAMLMSLNKGETADHGCHCWGNMAVRMRKVIAIPWSWYVCHSAKVGIGADYQESAPGHIISNVSYISRGRSLSVRLFLLMQIKWSFRSEYLGISQMSYYEISFES